MPKDQVIKKTPLAPTVLVSNGVSYLGLNLCAALLEKGARVVVIDHVDDDVRARAKTLLSNPNFALFNVDPEKGVPEKIQSVDYIFALTYPDDPLLERKNLVSEAFSVKGLLDLAVSSDAKFALVEPLFSLESEKGSQVEDYSYSKNSSFLRSLIWDYIEKSKLNGRIIRVCSVYGPGMPLSKSMGLARFMGSVLENRNLKIYGDGVEKGYYLYIQDAVEGIIKALFYKRTSDRIFKLLPSDSHADLEVAFILKSLANGELGMDYMEAILPSVIYDISLGEQVPRWEEETGFKEGLVRTLEGFGYPVNLHSFKPAKVIDSRLKEDSSVEAINSLWDISANESAEAPLQELSSKKAEPERTKAPLKIPKINLPKFSLPKIKNSSHSTEGSPLFTGKKLKLLYGFTFLFFLFLFFIGAPLATTLFSVNKAVDSLEEVSLNISKLQTEDSKNSAQVAFSSLHRAKSSFGRLRWLFVVAGQKDLYASLENTLESATYFTGSLYRTSKALAPLSSIWQVLKPVSTETFSHEDFELTKQELSYARRTLDMSLANYKRVDSQNVPNFISEPIEKYGEILKTADAGLNDALAVVDSLPWVLGLSEERTYLLLFQNSNEIRPTGGFIGSYATLTLKDGKIKALDIDDIYNPDGQIEDRRIASNVPAPIKEFLDEEILHIRNANWDPDFPSSAETIEDLFFKLDNRSFDGVVGVDLNVIKRLLEVTGPVFLAAYNEEVNADNVYERTQFHSEFDYQEGISTKRSFLTILNAKLLESVFALPSDKISLFAGSMVDSFESRNLMAVVKDPSLSSFLERKHWDGALVPPKGDYLAVVNANLGGTKANYFVENSYDYSVTSDTRDGLLRAHLTLSYKHKGHDSAWPGGPYTDYYRIYTPKGSKLTGVTQSFDNSLPEDIFGTVSSYEEDEYTVFAGSFILQPQQTLRLQVHYDLPESLSLSKEEKAYSLFWQKQAGTLGDLFRFDFKGPFGTSIVTYKPGDLFKEKNIAALEGYLDTDQEFTLEMK